MNGRWNNVVYQLGTLVIFIRAIHPNASKGGLGSSLSRHVNAMTLAIWHHLELVNTKTIPSRAAVGARLHLLSSFVLLSRVRVCFLFARFVKMAAVLRSYLFSYKKCVYFQLKTFWWKFLTFDIAKKHRRVRFGPDKFFLSSWIFYEMVWMLSDLPFYIDKSCKVHCNPSFNLPSHEWWCNVRP